MFENMVLNSNELKSNGNIEEIRAIEPENGETSDQSLDVLKQSLRMMILDLPKYWNHKELKKLIEKQMPSVEFRKLKLHERNGYVSFLKLEDVDSAMKIFDGFQVKGQTLKVKRVADEPVVERKVQSPKPLKSAVEIATPLASMPYEEQLKQKQQSSLIVSSNLKKQAVSAGVKNARTWEVETMLKQILPSPVFDKYRNKTELTIGYNENDEICVGFVATKLQEKRLLTVPVYECRHIRQNTFNVCRAFEAYIKRSEFLPFNEFERQGCWKTILIRDFTSDCMVVITVYPFEKEEDLAKVKKELIELFMSTKYEPTPNKSFRVTSLYLAIQAHSSDESKMEKLAGAPFVYETLFNLRFRISPNTFFQTNTVGAEVLYSVVGDALGLPIFDKKLRLPAIVGENDWQNGSLMHLMSKSDDKNEEDEPQEKKMKLEDEDEANTESVSKNRILLLDICCGAGTIGLSLAQRVFEAEKQNKFHGIYGLVGVEIVKEAISDAELTVKDNWLKSDHFRYVAGPAEAIFSSLNFYVPNCFKGNSHDAKLQPGEVLGVLDPPRAGMNSKVIIGCRKLKEMKRLVYVSCDPNAAIKNIIDLCRPESRKYDGEPFTVTSIQPVDMFPMTNHYEWVIQLDR